MELTTLSLSYNVWKWILCQEKVNKRQKIIQNIKQLQNKEKSIV